MKRSLLVWAAGSLLVLATACTHDHEELPPPAIKNVQLKQNDKLGSILTDVNGKTLYFFSSDANGQSACSGGCATTWPVFYVDAPDLSDGLAAADFSTITRTDGKQQTTYKGWPLYYYSKDTLAGDIKGEAFGGKWFTAKPDYSVMLAYTQLIGNDTKHYTSKYVEGDEVVPYLTDAYGRTLYAYTNDRFNKNLFTKQDFSNNAAWPIDTLGQVQGVPSLFNSADFSKIDVFGKTQLTYRGWPLYYFGSDSAKRGNTRGVSFPKPGIWPIVNQNSTPAVP
ncbi:hypothetical protein A4H97_32880 [Niastella yeongjuensis]|uniref:Lipoprotein n=1 Tax=Niastella yeongjuensis TaxID=354355 RepID=A0A1V9EGU9_9BACT|nr:hypothetical protein [Niastella yeongjuensis]OQP45135.1 hypothetical protein A4H97_32880 [Niastella yeongjuensis]SEP48643.1 Predicted lipoprotein with conserved Yx(FWY)xxD motif [Niastella yeongjuensis]